MLYVRQHVFVDGEKPTAANYNDEFDAIAQVVNGNIDRDNLVAGLFEQANIVIDASDPEYAPNGTESDATRVKNAIAAALGPDAATTLVYVPKSMWGYVGDADYDPDMYDTELVLVREGAIVAAFDPIAYGADPSGVDDSRPAVVAAFDGAVAAAGATEANVGKPVVAFTVPGSYKLNSDFERPADVALWQFDEVTFPDSSITGDRQQRDLPYFTEAEQEKLAGIGKGAKVIASSQTIPTDTNTEIEFDTETYDDDSFWDAGNPGRIVIPEDGRYLVGAQGSLSPGFTMVAMEIYAWYEAGGQGVVSGSYTVWEEAPSPYDNTPGALSVVEEFLAGDEVSLYVKHQGAGDETFGGTLWIQRVK